jgi:hypothetical protein
MQQNIYTNLLISRTLSPFNNRDVRWAMALSLDRKAIIDTLAEGYGDIGGDVAAARRPVGHAPGTGRDTAASIWFAKVMRHDYTVAQARTFKAVDDPTRLSTRLTPAAPKTTLRLLAPRVSDCFLFRRRRSAMTMKGGNSTQSDGAQRATALGHQDAFSRPRLSARSRFSQGTFAGTPRAVSLNMP